MLESEHLSVIAMGLGCVFAFCEQLLVLLNF